MHIIVNLLKIKDMEKMLKETRKKKEKGSGLVIFKTESKASHLGRDNERKPARMQG